ncbi:MAG: methylmalonyl-CoA mutase family protein [Gammaproteobacteria bacterium]|nr:methylmalonyl-CoA mutase family protein [Gammaproteobacteria bacterium]
MDEQIISAWRKKRTEKELSRIPETKKKFKTASGIEVKDVYTSLDVTPETHETLPGLYPLTRGIRASMYRNRPFTMRQVVGLGTAKHANERHRFVLSQGQTGLSNDFDLPTLTGYDSDDDKARGEVGRIGVAIDSIHDMRDLMSEIPLDSVSTSMTINHPAPVLLAMYLAVAEEQNVPWGRLNGTVQNDAFKEFFAQKTFAIGPSPSFRLACDVIEFCSHHAPKWNPISLCGYQTRDCGGTADQELGLTFAAAKAYIDETLKRGVDIDDFAPRLSFLMYVHMDVLEEVAKFRAARRMWARLLREEYGAKNEDSWRLRVHVQTGAALLTAQQPENNIARGALQCFAAALGGIQSMAISTYDEAYSIPSEKAQRLALRTQQIVALESGVTYTPDPLAGSYYVEALTNEIESRAQGWIDEVEKRGGMLAVTESGWIEMLLAEQAYHIQCEIESGERPVVGVNIHEGGDNDAINDDLFRVDPQVEKQQLNRLDSSRRQRDSVRAAEAMTFVKDSLEGTTNVMTSILEAVKASVSVGEIFSVMRSVWGTYKPPGIF